ncbi:anther-specific proline-rich protein APG-like [Raphanus sativus]|nr:anther-specific proline-rich protein APG-like [Raphanus sativus]
MDAARDTDADIKIIMSQILFKVADQIIDEFTGKIIAEDGADCKGLAKILASLGSADTDAGLGSIQQPSDYNTLQLGVDTYSDTLGSSRNLLGDMTGKGDSHSKEKHHRSSFFSVPACFRNPSSPDESREDSRRSKKGSKPSRKRDESSNRSYYSSHEYSEDSRSSRNPTSSKKESKRSRRSISPHHRRH